jgi:hypothetical protein
MLSKRPTRGIEKCQNLPPNDYKYAADYRGNHKKRKNYTIT